MQSTTLEFPHNARRTYTAIRTLFETKRTKFSGIDFNDDLFIVEARHGAWLSPFTEKVKMKVVATGSESCQVKIESSSRSWLNILNFGANKGNVSDLSDYINNEVYKLHRVETVQGGYSQTEDHSVIRIVKPNIKIK